MHLIQEFEQTDPSNGVKGNHVECVGIECPRFYAGNGWTGGRLFFEVWLNTEARAAGAASIKAFDVGVGWKFFVGLAVIEDMERTLAAVYNRKGNIPRLEGAEIVE